jgi:hypothetical protein
MTMHPDNYNPNAPQANHPARPFDEEMLMQPLHKRTTVRVVLPKPAARGRARNVLVAMAEAVVMVFTLVVLCAAFLLLFGTEAEIAAWGRWAQPVTRPVVQFFMGGP